MLCILTNEQVFCIPFAGWNHLFGDLTSFSTEMKKKEDKTGKTQIKYFYRTTYSNVPKISTIANKAREKGDILNMGYLKWQLPFECQ